MPIICLMVRENHKMVREMSGKSQGILWGLMAGRPVCLLSITFWILDHIWTFWGASQVLNVCLTCLAFNGALQDCVFILFIIQLWFYPVVGGEMMCWYHLFCIFIIVSIIINTSYSYCLVIWLWLGIYVWIFHLKCYISECCDMALIEYMHRIKLNIMDQLV